MVTITEKLIAGAAGFKREDIRVLVDSHGHLRTRGERHIAGNRWSRFQTDVDLPANCNADGIRAKFENDRLTITLPKSTSSAPIPAPPQRPHVKAPSTSSERLPPVIAKPVARPAAPRPLVPPAAPRGPPPSVKPPAEPRPSMPKNPYASVPAPAPAPAPAPQVEQPATTTKPAEPRPSMPKNPYASVPAPAPAPAPAPQVEQPATTTKPAESSLGAVQRPKEQEDRQRKREEEGKMAEDRKETVQEKDTVTEQHQQQEEKAMLAEKEMAFANQPGPAFASRGLLMNVAIAVVVLLGVTVHLWLSLRNATGGAGEHGHGPRADGGR
jgi:hypothetical protein